MFEVHGTGGLESVHATREGADAYVEEMRREFGCGYARVVTAWWPESEPCPSDDELRALLAGRPQVAGVVQP